MSLLTREEVRKILLTTDKVNWNGECNKLKLIDDAMKSISYDFGSWEEFYATGFKTLREYIELRVTTNYEMRHIGNGC